MKIVAKLNKNNITRMKAENILTEDVPITIVIWQGDSLSSILFNLFNSYSRNGRDNKGCKR